MEDKRNSVIFICYTLVTVILLVCLIATNLMWEACDYYLGVEPSILYKIMEAITIPYGFLFALPLVCIPGGFIRGLWGLWIFPILIVVFATIYLFRGQRGRRAWILFFCHVIHAGMLLYLGTQMLMSV